MVEHNRKTVYLAGFIFTLTIGFATYINSSFLSSLIGEKSTGVVFALASVCSVILLLLSPLLFKKIGGYKFLIFVALLDALTFLGVALLKNTSAVIVVFILGFALNALLVFSLDELLKIFSKNSDMGKIRGFYLSLGHVALIGSQLTIALYFGSFSFRMIYLLSFFIMLVFFLVCLFTLKNIPEPLYDKINSVRYVKGFFKQENLRRAYSINFLVQFFYAWMLIYTPIYLYAHLGFTLKELGTIFMIMLVPFLFIPIYAGKYADKIGERKMLMVGFTISAVFTISLFFVTRHSVWLWATLLFATRLGMATAESMSDTYFFKHIKPENEEFVGVYRSAPPVAYILGPLVAFIALALVPSFNYIFIILGAVMLYGVYLSSTIRKGDI